MWSATATAHSHGMRQTPRTQSQVTRPKAACLVAAPLVAVIARLLGTPWLEEPGEYLTELSRHTGRSDVGAELTLLSALLFIPAVLTLAALVRDRRRISVVGGALAVAGAVGLAAVSIASLVAGQMARLDNRDAMVDLWDRILAEPPMQVFPLLLAAGAVGLATLAVGLYRTRAVPRLAAVLVGVGGAASMLTSVGPVRAAVVGAAAVALAGFAWIAVAAQRPAQPHHAAPTVAAATAAAGQPSRPATGRSTAIHG